MANETEVIRQQMDDTRTALQDKLETLEQQVKDTVQEATEGVQTVKEAVQETVNNVKESLDFKLQYQQHPWLFFAGATAIGVVGSTLLLSRSRGHAAAAGPAAATVVSATANGNGVKAAAPTARPTMLGRIAEHYRDEIDKLQSLAVGAAIAVVRELIAPATPAALADPITEILDSVTVKLGGKPIHEPLFRSAGSGEEKGEPAEYGHASPCPPGGRRVTA